MWQTLYYIAGTVCTVGLSLYGIFATKRVKKQKDRAPCEQCKFCVKVEDDGDIVCNATTKKNGGTDNFSTTYYDRLRYCGRFEPKEQPKDDKVEDN